jgi:mono/diheme cytochrome c family protein
MSASAYRRTARTHQLFSLLVFGLLASFAVAARKPGKQDGPAAQLSKAPTWARALQNPLAGQTEAAAAGRKLYEQHCAECHGPDGRGLEHAANLHSTPIQNAPPGVLFWALRNGRIRRGMPSWAQLPDQQIWQIVTYLKALK